VKDSLEKLQHVRQLLETGQFAEVVFALADREEEVAESPTLSLCYGTAHARLGEYNEGSRWVEVALNRSRSQGDRTVELRALNARGAIALGGGKVDEAYEFFTSAAEIAEREGDHGTLGRCSNNLGIVHNLRGDHGAAVGAYTAALAAFQQAYNRRGVAETHHNLSITYRDRGELERSLEEADRAIDEAGDLGAVALHARTLAGRAETRLAMGDAEVAGREVERAIEMHRELGDEVGEAEDRRILGLTLVQSGSAEEAENVFKDVVHRSQKLQQPLLIAMATKDLAFLFESTGQTADALDHARAARTHFHELGAQAEVGRLDDLIDRCRNRLLGSGV
jgi:tetratricopeptide (TPR) repeat protein